MKCTSEYRPEKLGALEESGRSKRCVVREQKASSASGALLPLANETPGTAGARSFLVADSLRHGRRRLTTFKRTDAPLVVAEFFAVDERLLVEHSFDIAAKVFVFGIKMSPHLFGEVGCVKARFLAFGTDAFEYLAKLLINRIKTPIDSIEAVIELLFHCGETAIDCVKTFVDTIKPFVDTIETLIDSVESCKNRRNVRFRSR